MKYSDSDNVAVIAEVKNGSGNAFETLCEIYDPLIRSMVEHYSRMTDAGDSRTNEIIPPRENLPHAACAVR